MTLKLVGFIGGELTRPFSEGSHREKEWVCEREPIHWWERHKSLGSVSQSSLELCVRRGGSASQLALCLRGRTQGRWRTTRVVCVIKLTNGHSISTSLYELSVGSRDWWTTCSQSTHYLRHHNDTTNVHSQKWFLPKHTSIWTCYVLKPTIDKPSYYFFFFVVFNDFLEH